MQRYSLEEGLSQQAVNAITQDAEGFMWFGTEDGLNRFDGYEFRQLRHDRADEQLAAQRLDLFAGRRAKTACGSAPTAAAWCSATRRPASSRAPAAVARCAPTCSACARWRATASAGSGSPRATPASPFSIRAPVSCSACATRPPSRSSLSDNSIFSILPLRSGDKLIGTATGLDRLSAANLDVTRIALPGELAPAGQPLRVRALTESADGMVWVGTDDGLGRYDPRNERWRVYREDASRLRRCPTTACRRCSSTARAGCGSA